MKVVFNFIEMDIYFIINPSHKVQIASINVKAMIITVAIKVFMLITMILFTFESKIKIIDNDVDDGDDDFLIFGLKY